MPRAFAPEIIGKIDAQNQENRAENASRDSNCAREKGAGRIYRRLLSSTARQEEPRWTVDFRLLVARRRGGVVAHHARRNDLRRHAAVHFRRIDGAELAWRDRLELQTRILADLALHADEL